MSRVISFLVAVVEDNAELRTDLVEYLNLQGYTAQGFDTGEAFFKAWPASSFHLLLLDVALPGMSGLEVSQQVRAQATGCRSPEIVMLTALDSSIDHVQGLAAGADMYLSKRSPLEVIDAACQSVWRRLERDATTAAEQSPLVAHGTWQLHTRDWIITAPNGLPMQLTHAEVVMLSLLFEQPGQAVTRAALLHRLDKRDTLSNLRNLDNTTSRLRRKALASCGMELPLRPSYGRGYTFSGHCRLVT